MKQFFNLNLKDPVYKTGLILVTISFLIFALTTNITSDISAGIFVINYSIAIIYQIYLITSWYKEYKWKWGKGDLRHTVLLLVLLFISAFALNREMNVFDASVTWCSVWIILSATAVLLASNLNGSANRLWKTSIFFALGSALVLFIYYAIYLFPLYLISLVGLLAIGISIHSYVPAFLAAATLVVIIRAIRQDKKLWYPVSLGFLLPILFAGAFSAKWFYTNKEINTVIDHNTLNEPKLPAWIQVSQQLTPNFMTERLLKTGLVYHEVDMDHLFWASMPGTSYDEKKQHDPLVVIATLLFKRPNLNEQDRIKILKSMYQARHQAQDRLWAGDHLETISMVSNIKLFPAYRMAYTEKTLSIRNNAHSAWNNQEAIYTFHLTEGSVVSALSLWINGKEEKSRLTTKAKADSAYRTIVGVEQHDPSVIHWQEGNTITVRVFPCTPKENRKFRIGITSPMLKKGNQLTYQPISFDGPVATHPSEITQVTYLGPIKDLQLPSGFTQTSPGVYQSENNDDSALKISCAATPLSTAAFSFAGAGYQLENYTKRYSSFTAKHLYLDMNRSWTKAEFDAIWANAQGKAVYVFDDKMIRLNAQNRDALFTKLTRYNFSLFPIQEISHPEQSLLISKGGLQAPNLGDLEDSIFGDELVDYLKIPKRLQVFNIGQLESPYLKALKELRVLSVETGTVSDLKKMLSRHIFIQNQENEQTVVIEDAGMLIRKTNTIQTQNAPDHLLRLFAYNDIMKKVGPDFFSKKYIRPELIAEAEQAFIVSPVSSFIVLESQKDYDRFDIEANKNSLKNASMKSSGAVPEPHEWVLFILCIGTATYVLYKKRTINTVS